MFVNLCIFSYLANEFKHSSPVDVFIKLNTMKIRRLLLSAVLTLFSTLSAFSSTIEKTAVERCRCNDVETVGDNVWVATGARVVRIEKATGAQTEFVVDEVNEIGQYMVNNIAAHGGDDIWFSCSVAGTAHYDGAEFTVENGLQAMASKMCRRVAVDGDGNPWASTGIGGIWSLDGNRWSQTYPYCGEGVGMFYTTGMAFDMEGTLWWMSSQMSEGFGYCAPGAGWQAVTAQNNGLYEALADYKFTSLAIDGGDTKWLGLNWPEVVAYHKDGTWERIKLISDFENGVDYVFDVNDAQTGPDGRIWVAYKQSLFAVGTGNSVEETRIPLDVEAGIITCFKHDGDVIWIGTSKGGLYKWTGSSVEHFDLSAGVERVATDGAADETPIYDLHGRRVERMVPGQIYVRGGRKTLHF